MERVIKIFEDDMEWYVTSGKLDGSDLFTSIYVRLARERDIRLSHASEEEMQQLEDLARAEFDVWDAHNDADRLPFPEFRSGILAELHELGDIAFMGNAAVLQRTDDYINRFWFHEALYLQALMDTLHEKHGQRKTSIKPILRNCKLEKPLSAVSVDEPFELGKGLPLFAERNIFEPDIEQI